MNNISGFSLESPIEFLPRVGRARTNDFKKLGVENIRDLLFHFPFRYEDFSNIVKASELKIGEQSTVRCQVMMIKNQRSPRKRRIFTEALFSDETGSIKAVWFNQSYLPKILHRGDWIYLSGILEESYFGIHMTNPVFEQARETEATLHVGRLVPIYRTRGELTSRYIRNLIALALPAAKEMIDWLPDEIRKKNNFPKIQVAIRNTHLPETKKELYAGRDRLAFDELFLAQLTACHARAKLDRSIAPQIQFNEEATKKFVSSLPFELTNDQRRTSWEIIKDLNNKRPMNRLLQGDVGSGKTVVATIAILNTALSGQNILYLAPTEILATQHAKNIKNLLKGFSISIGLLTSGIQTLNNEKIDRSELESKINEGKVNLVIGTHAILNEKLKIPQIGLVIIDEQHRFGVEQRKLLRGKSNNGTIPHLLSMTATPIPRTLALTAYGDLDISSIYEMPKGRLPITTRVVHEPERNKTYEMIRAELRKGRQGFVICPLISESDKLGVRSATKEFEKLQKIFPEFKLGIIHGKLSSDEKQKTMDDFKNNKINLLIATAVIEVGIDIRNATIMIIEGAERFGLAQLHQFRGRIGRGSEKSSCYLFADTETEEINERLLVFAKTFDGFKLAEYDLELRGPGEIFGMIQSGFPRFRIADFKNIRLLDLARREAKNLLDHDHELTGCPLLKEKFDILSKKVHLE